LVGIGTAVNNYRMFSNWWQDGSTPIKQLYSVSSLSQQPTISYATVAVTVHWCDIAYVDPSLDYQRPINAYAALGPAPALFRGTQARY
jgi:hypothetical protein